MIEIYEATSNDYGIIQEIAHQTWPATYDQILSRDQINYMLDKMYSISSLREQNKKYGHRFILAKVENTNTGFASYEINFNALNITKIHKFYILPIEQGRGIGKSLLSKISDQAKQNGNNILTLNVNKNNPTIKFYQKVGFLTVREDVIAIGNDFIMDDFLMEKYI